MKTLATRRHALRRAHAATDRALRSLLTLLLLALAPLAAQARTILVVVPHEGNETMMAAGRIRSAVDALDTVKVAIVTNGGDNAADHAARQAEVVAATSVLGLAEEDVVFLGYGAGTLTDLYYVYSDSQVIEAPTGESATAATRGLGGTDFHSYLTGDPAPYTREALRADLQALLLTFQPDEVYSTSYFDLHPDGRSLGRFISEAAAAYVRSGASPGVKLYQGIIWMPEGGPLQEGGWPLTGDPFFTPWLPFPQPECCLETATTLDWSRLTHFTVPAEMQSDVAASNLKHLALSQYSQVDSWWIAFARADEIFWLNDFGANLAMTATISFSSEDWEPHGGLKAVDGIAAGSPHGWTNEWVSGELDGAWFQLDWATPVVVSQVNLSDRHNPYENVLAGTLSFSDGSTVAVGALPVHGQLASIAFAPKTVTWVRFTIDQAEGGQSGLSEIEVIGQAAATP